MSLASRPGRLLPVHLSIHGNGLNGLGAEYMPTMLGPYLGKMFLIIIDVHSRACVITCTGQKEVAIFSTLTDVYVYTYVVQRFSANLH